MGNLFHSDSPVIAFLEKAANLIILNLLCLICCLPVITVIPAVSALYYVTLKMVRGEEPYIARSFFRSLRENLKQGILFNILYLALTVFLLMELRICILMDSTLGRILTIFIVILSIVFLFVIVYTGPLLAQFENSMGQTFKNAFLLSMAHPVYTVIVTALHAIPFILILYSPYHFLQTVMFWLSLGFSGTAWINSFLFQKIFAKYISG